MEQQILSLENSAMLYFETWNSHNLKNLKMLFNEKCILRDWTLMESGIENVINANKKIFEDVPNIRAEVLFLHVSESTNSVCAEIIVHINDSSSTELKVVDVITFDTVGLIKSIRAYQG